MKNNLIILLQLLRPHHYIKNSFVFCGILFSYHWTFQYIIHSFYIFVAFCLVSSSVYILNDIVDIERDQKHPQKKSRPLPSNKISVKSASIILIILLLTSIGISYYISINSMFFVISYFLLNVLYSSILKNIVILDIFIISMGFMCRIMAGTFGLNIEPSEWLLLCGLMITLFLGFSKRFAEIIELKDSHNIGTTRPVLVDYSESMLERFMTICAACSIMCYGLYTVAPETLTIHKNAHLIYSVPIVAYGILRYLYLIYMRQCGNDTSRDLLTDKHIHVTIICWITTIIILLG